MTIEYSQEFFVKIRAYFPEAEKMHIFKSKIFVIVEKILKNFPLMYAQNAHFEHRIFSVSVASQSYLIAYKFYEKENKIIIANIKHVKEDSFQ